MSVATPHRSVVVPAFIRSRKAVADHSAGVILKLVPDLASGARAAHKFFATLLTIIGLCGFLALLGVNTLLAQDAFALSDLKAQAKMVADQREAISRQIDASASPEALAIAAEKLGMKLSDTPVFLDLTPVNSGMSANG